MFQVQFTTYVRVKESQWFSHIKIIPNNCQISFHNTTSRQKSRAQRQRNPNLWCNKLSIDYRDISDYIMIGDKIRVEMVEEWWNDIRKPLSSADEGLRSHGALLMRQHDDTSLHCVACDCGQPKLGSDNNTAAKKSQDS